MSIAPARGDIVFTTGDVDFYRAGFAEGNHTGIEPVYQGAE